MKNIKAYSLSFDNTLLPDTIYLENISVHEKINFLSSLYQTNESYFKRRYLYIDNIDITKLLFKYKNFRLLFTNTKGQMKSDVEIVSIYEGLLKKFKENNDLESYKLIDIEYKKHLDDSYFKISSFLNEWWWNFGYNRNKIFRHTIFFIIFFTIITFFFLKRLQKNVYELSWLTKVEKDDKKIYSHYGSRLWYSFIYTLSVFLNYH